MPSNDLRPAVSTFITSIRTPLDQMAEAIEDDDLDKQRKILEEINKIVASLGDALAAPPHGSGTGTWPCHRGGRI